MTPLPKRKHSTQRKGKRKTKILITLPPLSPCLNCGELILPHSVCPKCGFYKGIKRIEVKNKKKKKSK